MDKQSLERWQGLEQLLHDGVEIGATAIESYHRRAADRPFDILESIKPIAVPTRIVRVIHDGILSLTYGSIRTISRSTVVLQSGHWGVWASRVSDTPLTPPRPLGPPRTSLV